MASQVLYRKWRPQRFAEVVGQEVVTQTLRQAVAQGRLAHAYLFAGPRGTGKTTTARILAKAVNCPRPQEGEPCNACPPCLAIREGRFLDLVEMDAASHRGIDDVRDLQERVVRAPAEGRYKVYIIDEAHQLTLHAFNALLKTLEEPPPHALFILCTTEPHQLPATILSRCQRYDFRRIPARAVAERLARIAEAEGFRPEPQALDLLARAAGGSLRDACNLLEQAVISYGPQVTTAQVREMLGLTAGEWAGRLARLALDGNLAEGLALLSRVVQEGGDLRGLHRETVEFLRAVMLAKAGAEDTLDLPPEAVEEVRDLAHRTPWPRVLRALRAFGTVSFGRADALSPLPLELALAECAGLEEAPASPPPSPAPPRQEAAAPAPRPAPPPPPPEPLPEGAEPVSDALWSQVCRALRRTRFRRFFLGPLLQDCTSRRIEGDTLVLVFRSAANLERFREELEDPRSRRALEEALRKVLHRDYRLDLRSAEGATGPRNGGHLIRTAMAMGARIVAEEETP